MLAVYVRADLTIAFCGLQHGVHDRRSRSVSGLHFGGMLTPWDASATRALQSPLDVR